MPSERTLSAVILAAGEGTRMKSANPKVLFTVCGRPIVNYLLDTVASLHPQKIVLVVGHKGEAVEDAVRGSWNDDKSYLGELSLAWQKERKGTGHAVMCALELLPDEGDVLIMNGDTTPLLAPKLLQEFDEHHRREGAGLSLISYIPDDPASYGRVVRGQDGRVQRIVEARDLAEPEKGLREVNSGIYMVQRDLLGSALRGVTDDNAKGEFYITDIVKLAAERGARVTAMVASDPSQVLGFNDRRELAVIEGQKRRLILDGLMLGGVTVRDPASTFVDYGVSVGRDTALEPNTYLKGKTAIGSNCVIGPGSEISDSTVGDSTRIWSSVVEGSDIGQNVQIGPYSHIRPNSVLREGAFIGNFAEVKNSVIGQGTKIHHHSYIGDTDMGAGVNIGAGTVTVNFDGTRKHRTVIEDGAFVGCNANLIAPVKIGKGAYVAAGSTVNLEVPADSLAIARERQVVKEGWAARRKEQGR